jgi:ATP diphosphatase
VTQAWLRTPGTDVLGTRITFETIAPYTIEEAYEVADAIERKDMGELKGELGDLLFQSVFHARMAEEAGHFTIDDVVRSLVDKMVDRHPHVFGDTVIHNAAAQTGAWEVMKAAERARKAERVTRSGERVGLRGAGAAGADAVGESDQAGWSRWL